MWREQEFKESWTVSQVTRGGVIEVGPPEMPGVHQPSTFSRNKLVSILCASYVNRRITHQRYYDKCAKNSSYSCHLWLTDDYTCAIFKVCGSLLTSLGYSPGSLRMDQLSLVGPGRAGP